VPGRIGSLRAWSTIALLAVATGATASSDPRLVEAARQKNREAVRALLAQNVDVNAPQSDGATALHWAAHRNDLDIADLLLRAGARASAANDYGITPLSLACTNRSAAMVEKLLAAGANPNLAQSNGETPLMSCVRTGSAEAVQMLLARGANVNTKEHTRGQTALMWAAARAHSELVRILIEHGADLHARSNVTRLLVNSARNLARGVFELEKGGFTPFLFASRSGDVDSAKLLLAAGAAVNDPAPDGNSALVIASHSGHGRLAAFLLDKGANPNAAGAGYTALHAAVLRGDLDLVKALLAHGADANAQLTKGTPMSRFGQDFSLGAHLIGATPFFLAAKYAELEMMRALAAAGAHAGTAAKDGTSPLMAAAGIGWGLGSLGGSDRRERYLPLDVVNAELQDESRTLAAVQLVAELGGDVSAGNADGDTALHGAAAKGFRRVVDFLVQRGARVDAKNKRGQTPEEMLRKLDSQQ
jgi:ankyrin repeat protein